MGWQKLAGLIYDEYIDDTTGIGLWSWMLS